MFNIDYETWESVCEMYFGLLYSQQCFYLQWYPFAKLNAQEKEFISSEAFYNKFIKYGSFVMYPNIMLQTDNYVLKGDGTFRDASLISPILYLVLQSIGKSISDSYLEKRQENIKVFYAGNYDLMQPRYKKSYDNFYKEIESCKEWANYFIKTDISNFFSNIDLDKMIRLIDDGCNQVRIAFSQTNLQLIKTFLKYCGAGKFPLVENSIASSYLSTIVYLDGIDTSLYNYIAKHCMGEIDAFEMVRYVDDLYIVFSSEKSYEELMAIYNEVIKKYSSLLKECSLNLNTKKIRFGEYNDISQELKKSTYTDGIDFDDKLELECRDKLEQFLRNIIDCLKTNCITIEKYNEIVNNAFYIDSFEYTPTELFNYCVYENQNAVSSECIQKLIEELIDFDISFLSFDPKRLTALFLATKSEALIKKFLNVLFVRQRADKWTCYDSTIAITYLVQRNFKHSDLIELICAEEPKLYTYCRLFCIDKLNCTINDNEIEKLCSLIDRDTKTFYLHFMYLCSITSNNYLDAYAFYKNYFDRITAVFNRAKNGGKAKIKVGKYYKKDALKDFYNCIKNSGPIISEAAKMRDSNPLAHASAELIDKDSTKNDIDYIVNELDKIVMTYLNENFVS